MRLRKVKNAEEILLNSPYFIENPQELKGHWQEILKDEKEIHLEIGCGKGQFLIEMAKTHPDIFFIGMEYQKSVLVRAIHKANLEDLPNLKFICFNAESVDSLFSKEIDVLYLNFSDPWPKRRHAKRRLTDSHFLEIYDSIFKKKQEIIQKTDNPILFESSLENLSKHGFTLEKISFDLENTDIPNIKTEYEEKFINLGYSIYYVKAIKK